MFLSFLFAILITPCVIRTQTDCLAFDPDYPPDCLVCKAGSFQKDFAVKVVNLTGFPPGECIKQSAEVKIVKEFFISDLSCESLNTCNGSLASPFGNFNDALKAGHLYSQGTLGSNITIYFIRKKNQTQAEYFWDSWDYETYNFFRRANLNLTIAPLFCSDRNIVGCFRNTDPRPILYLRTEKSFIFVSNILTLENVVIDGSEIAFDDLSVSRKSEFANKRFCNESKLETPYNISDESEEGSVCFLKNKRSNSSSNKFSLFNIEPLFDCDACKTKPSSVILNKTEFKDIYSNGKSFSSLTALVSAQRLKFTLQIENSTFSKISLMNGVFFTSGVLVPKLYLWVQSLFVTAVGDQTKNTNRNFVSILNSSFFSFDYFQIDYQTSNITSIFSMISIAHDLLISGSLFFSNFLNSTFFLVSIPANETDIFANVTLISNLIQNNFINRFLDFNRANDNIAGKKYSGIFKNNKFINNIDCIIKVRMLEFNVSGLTFSNSILRTSSFFNIYTGRVFAKDSLFTNISSSASDGAWYIFEFTGTLPYTIGKIFTGGSSSNYSKDSAYIENSYFLGLSTGLVYSYSVLNYLRIFNCSLINGIYPYYDLVHAKVESDINITSCKFDGLDFYLMFYLYYTRNIYFKEVLIQNIDVRSFLETNLFAVSKVRPVNDFRFVILRNSILSNYFFKNLGENGDGPIYNFQDCVFDNLNSGELLYLEIIHTAILSNCLFSNIDSSSKIMRLSGTWGTENAGDTTILNCTIIISNGKTIEDAIFSVRFRKFRIDKTKIIGEGGKCIQSSSIFLDEARNVYPVKLTIVNSLFYNLTGMYGGAIFLQLLQVDQFLMEYCQFIENNGNGLSADINIRFFAPVTGVFNNIFRDNLQLKSFGIRNNFFKSSKGTYGNAIGISERTQALIYNNTFLDTTSDSGGCLYAKDYTEVYFIRNFIRNSSALNQGGAIYSVNSIMYVYDCYFNQTRANSGGVLLALNVSLKIYNTVFLKSEADIGGAVYCIKSLVKMKNIYTFETNAVIQGGSLAFMKGELQLTNVNISNSNCEGYGAGIYLNYLVTIQVRNLNINQANTTYDGVIFLSGKPSTIIKLADVSCSKTKALGQGDCLFLSNTDVWITNLTLINIESVNSIIYVTAIKTKSTLQLENSIFENSKLWNTFLSALVSITVIENFTISTVAFLSNKVKVLYTEQSIYKIYNLSAVLQTQGIVSSFLSAYTSIINISAVKLLIYRSASAMFFETCGDVTINNSQIYQATSSSPNSGGAITLKKSSVLISNTNFINCNADNGAAIYSEDSNMTLLTIFFYGNQAVAGGALIHSIRVAKDSIFFIKAFNLVSINNFGNEIYASEYDEFSMSLGVFNRSNVIPSEPSAQVVNIEGVKSIKFSNLSIEGFHGISPLTIKNQESQKSLLFFENIAIVNCSSTKSGGGISLEGSINGTIRSSHFSGLETNESGGAIAFACTKEDCDITIEKCLFEKIKALKYGSIIKSDNIGVHFGEGNEFKNITTGWGNLSVGKPDGFLFLKNYPSDWNKAIKKLKKMGLDNSTIMPEIENIVPGQITALISVITDQNNNTLIFENEGKVTLSTLDNNSFFENGITFVKNGFAIFSNLKINSPPGNTIEVLIEYINQVTMLTFSQKFKMKIRKCIRGEIATGITCQICPKGYFSLEDEPSIKAVKVCGLCPLNAECQGGHNIVPTIGFWRKDENQTEMLACPIDGSCPGGGLIDGVMFSPICLEGYKGSLCLFCEENYGQNVDRNCIKCSEAVSHYLKFGLLTFFSLCLIIFQTHHAQNINVVASKSRAVMKILVDHLSYVTLISTFKIDWSSIVLNILTVGDQYVSTVPSEMFNFECFIILMGLTESKFIINFIFISTTPIVYSIICFMLLIVFTKVKEKIKKQNVAKTPEPYKDLIQTELKTDEAVVSNVLHSVQNFQNEENNLTLPNQDLKKEKKSSTLLFKETKTSLIHQFTIMVIVIFYNFYPRIMLNAVKLLSCVKIDDTHTTYMEKNIDIECWGPEHIKMLCILTLPNIIIWGICTPILIFLLTKTLIKLENKTGNSNRKKIIDYVTLDYKRKFFFWDVFIYFSKFLIVVLTISISTLETTSQGALLIFLFLFLFLIQEKLKPYNYDFANNLKTLSYITTICSTALAIMASNKKSTDSQKVVCVFFSIFSTCLFYFGWLFQFIIIQKNKIKEKRLLNRLSTTLKMKKSSTKDLN